METVAPASFIPHDTGQPEYVSRSSGGLPELVLLIAIVLFVASSALAVGVFLYNQYLQTASASKVQQLNRAKAAFEPSLVQQLMRLNDRMTSADLILGNHLAPSAFFDALQQATLSTVSFANLDLQAVDTHQITIKMNGVAQSVNSIALQADLFSKNGVIKDPIFSGIDRQQDGVHFQLSAEVNTSAIRFANVMAAAASQTAGAASTQTQMPTKQNLSPFGIPQDTTQTGAKDTTTTR